MPDATFIAKTQSICQECFQTVEADVIEKGGYVYLKKRCPAHGTSEVRHIFDIPRLYRQMDRVFCRNQRAVYPHDLILYVTSRCNLTCPVCYADAGPQGTYDMPLGEIIRILDAYRGKMVHISGGEPTMREDLCQIIRTIKQKGFQAGLFSNGLKLADPGFVAGLKKAGLDMVILQFDSFDEQDLRALRGAPLLREKLKAIENSASENIGLYLFSAVVQGINDDQILPLIEFAKEHIRTVDVMNFNPLWRLGRYNGFERIPASLLYERIAQGGYLLDEFLSCTELSHQIFRSEALLLGKQWTRQPPCAQRLYLCKVGDTVVKITDMLDVGEFAKRLDAMNEHIAGARGALQRWILFFMRAPFVFMAKEMLRSKTLRAFICAFIKDALGRSSGGRLISSRMTSIMVGAFHSPEDADFHFLNRCTLYSNSKRAGSIRCACLRQIEASHKKPCALPL